MTSQRFPFIPDGLVEALREVFPDKAPRGELSQFELGVLSGQQQLLDWLSEKKRQQERKSDVYPPEAADARASAGRTQPGR